MRQVPLILLLFIGFVRGHPDGAPDSACADMTPNHGDNNGDQSLAIKVEPHQTCYKPGIDVMVKVTGPSKTKINGILAIARATGEGDSTSQGTWYPALGNKLKKLTCFGNADSAITHSERINTYSAVGLVWQPPSQLTKGVSFKVTVVNEKNKFWVAKQSVEIQYDSNCVQKPYTLPVYKDTLDPPPGDKAAAHYIILPVLVACTSLAIFINKLY